MPSVLAALDVSGDPNTLGLPALSRCGVLLVDGLGAELLTRHQAEARWTSGRLPVQSQVVDIQQVALTMSHPETAAAFYRDVLELPVSTDGGRVAVTIGSSSLVLERGEQFHGVHHLAVGIAPADFELARSWLSQRVAPISVDGSEVIDGPEGWDSKSLYFLGPEDIVLEYIARQAHGHLPVSKGPVPRPLSLSEVGIGVPDVQEAVGDLHRVLDLPPLPSPGLKVRSGR